jgi:16S rRNA A1518/A1519 N6-dimethyltransferase RsmA/KsgA/DIM1 with predicted DNA glycosylase/AP lyase activity
VIEGRSLSAADVEALCARAAIDPRVRGESLSLEEFSRLAAALDDSGIDAVEVRS